MNVNSVLTYPTFTHDKAMVEMEIKRTRWKNRIPKTTSTKTLQQTHWSLKTTLMWTITSRNCRRNSLMLTFRWVCCKASTTSSLDLCLPASPDFTGPWNEKPSPLIVITLKLHPFHISHLFLNVKLNLPYLDFDFSTLMPSKNCCGMWNRNEACPTPICYEFWTQI